MAPRISDDLQRWAARAGLSLTKEDHSGAALFWTDPGGEVRFYVRGSEELGYTLSSSERGQAEQNELYGSSVRVIERHLFAVFCPAVRSKLRLPRLIFPSRRDQLAAGYTLSDPDQDGYVSLSDSDGLVAKARGRVTSVSILVRLSRLLSSSLQDLELSCEDPDGHPLFAVKI
jgi:hypothetical protein